jgi:ketosteroid isomerase-like protein
MGIAENKQLARRFVEAISRGDIDAIQQAFAKDGTVWTIGTLPISGTFTADQVTAASRRVLELFPEGLEITIKGMTAEDDRVAIEAVSHGRHKSGRIYANVYHFLMRVHDGKIVEWREYLDTEHARDVLCEGM